MKNINKIALLIITVFLLSCGQSTKKSSKKVKGNISINWSDDVPGDFSFVNNWSYPEGVYKNKFGELSWV